MRLRVPSAMQTDLRQLRHLADRISTLGRMGFDPRRQRRIARERQRTALRTEQPQCACPIRPKISYSFRCH
jgi:hypothetical protein